MQDNVSDKVSIIIPIYNSKKYLYRCINSVINQTYPILEIILIDDGSTDGSHKLCDDFAKEDERILVIHQENKGVSNARNIGIDIASGKYLLFVDSDDYCKKDMVEIMLEHAIRNKVDAVFCGYVMEYEDGNILNQIVKPKFTGVVSKDEALLHLNLKDSYGCILTNKMFRMNIVKKQGKTEYFNNEYFIGEDIVWESLVIKQCNQIYLCNQPLYYYYMHRGSACHEVRLDLKNYSHIMALKEYIKICEEVDERIADYGRVKLYDHIRKLYMIAYYKKDSTSYNRLRRECDRRIKIVWLKSDQVTFANKCRQIVTELLMLLHFPRDIVVFLFNFGIKVHYLKLD